MINQALVLLLTFGAILPPPPALQVSQDQNSNDPAKPQTALWKSADLSADVRGFYERIAAKLKLPLDAVLGPLSDSYIRRQFEFFEFESALKALRHIIETKDDNLWKNAVSDESLKADSRDVIVLYLDPTCEICQHTLEMVTEARALSDTNFPMVIMRVIPSSEDTSIEAAIVLRSIEQVSPSLFEDAFREFLHLLPTNPSRLPDLSIAYIDKPPSSLPGYSTLRRELLSGKKRFNAAGYFPPVVSYRGRTLRKDQGVGVPFDPLHDSQSLLQTIILIRSFDAESDQSSKP